MTAATLSVGGSIRATVTKAAPFGALVESADGTPGLVTGLAQAAPGDIVEIRIDAVDPVKVRFSATAA